MKRFIIGLCTLALFMPSLAWASDCSLVEVTDAMALYVPIGGEAPVEISFDTNVDSLTVGTARISMKFCLQTGVITSCQDYDYDSDNDGIADTNVLTTATVETSGVKDVRGFPFLLLESEANESGVEDARVAICRVRK